METVVDKSEVTCKFRYRITGAERARVIAETGLEPGLRWNDGYQHVELQVTLGAVDDTAARALILRAGSVYLSEDVLLDAYTEDPLVVAQAILDAADARERERQEEHAAKVEAERAEILANPGILVEEFAGRHVRRHVYAELADDPAVAEAVAWAEGEIERRNAIAEAERAARVEAAARAREEYERDRARWIAEHGSSRLRRCVAEGIEHDAIYRDERIEAELPAWQWSAIQSAGLPGGEPRNPPEEALDLLDRARETRPDAVLRYLGNRRWVGHFDDPDRDESYDDDPESCPACDKDGDHRISTAEYRCYSEFLGRRITTKDKAGA